MRLRRPTLYAIAACRHLARQPRSAYSTAKELAQVLALPKHSLASDVLKPLARFGILRSSKGRGFRLAKRKVTVLDLVEAIEGPLLPEIWAEQPSIHALCGPIVDGLRAALVACPVAEAAED